MAKYCRWNVFFSKYKEFFLLLGNFTAGLMKRFDMQRIKMSLLIPVKGLTCFIPWLLNCGCMSTYMIYAENDSLTKPTDWRNCSVALRMVRFFFSTFSFISVWKVFTGISIIATISKLFKVQLMMWKKETTGTR